MVVVVGGGGGGGGGGGEEHLLNSRVNSLILLVSPSLAELAALIVRV